MIIDIPQQQLKPEQCINAMTDLICLATEVGLGLEVQQILTKYQIKHEAKLTDED